MPTCIYWCKLFYNEMKNGCISQGYVANIAYITGIEDSVKMRNKWKKPK